MVISVKPATTPEAALENHETHFNAGDIEGMVSLFADEGIVVTTPSGDPVGGRSGTAEAIAGFVDLGVTLDANVRRVYQSGDIALLIVDWELIGPDANGDPFYLSGTATDVVSRAEDGTWHYRIDNAFGSQNTVYPTT